MNCPVRVGKGLIEVNPIQINDLSDKALEERLRVEVIRILLKHPYERQPDGCSPVARALGSNCVISESYRLQHIKMKQPVDFALPSKQHFEYYARSIQKLLPKTPQSNQLGEGDSDGDAI